MRKLIYLAKLGICISTDENGKAQVQRIDSPEEFKQEWGLNFLPEKLNSDEEAKAIFDTISVETLNNILL